MLDVRNIPESLKLKPSFFWLLSLGELRLIARTTWSEIESFSFSAVIRDFSASL